MQSHYVNLPLGDSLAQSRPPRASATHRSGRSPRHIDQSVRNRKNWKVNPPQLPVNHDWSLQRSVLEHAARGSISHRQPLHGCREIDRVLKLPKQPISLHGKACSSKSTGHARLDLGLILLSWPHAECVDRGAADGRRARGRCRHRGTGPPQGGRRSQIWSPGMPGPWVACSAPRPIFSAFRWRCRGAAREALSVTDKEVRDVHSSPSCDTGL